MKELKCASCGGAMVIDPSACRAVCHYCGNQYVLNREDTDFYTDFHKQMQHFLAGSTEEYDRKTAAEKLWESAPTEEFETTDGNVIEIKYMHKVTGKYADTYVARRNVIYVFRREGIMQCQNYKAMVDALSFPAADSKNLRDFFPCIRGGYTLSDGRTMLVIEKNEDEYPLSQFGTLPPRHVAWILSRLENICCVLEYSGIVHPKINPDTVFINPYDHSAMLYGGYEYAVRKNQYDIEHTHICRMTENLMELREVGRTILDEKAEPVPGTMKSFFEGKPCEDAYDDFALWDETLYKSYGKRRFVKMDTDDKKIYG